jgi:hypothetical protein
MKSAPNILQAVRTWASAAYKSLTKFARPVWQTLRTQAVDTSKAVRRDPSPAGAYRALRRAI